MPSNDDLRTVREFFEQPEVYLRNRHIVDLRRDLARELLKDLKGAVILDLGCGDGSISLPLLRDSNRLVLVDFSTGMLELARASIPEGLEGSVDIHNIDVDAFDSQERFDVVICMGVLAHVPSAEGTFRHVVGHLKPGGLCLIQITDHHSPMSRILRLFSRINNLLQLGGGYETNRTTRSEVERWAQDCGLSRLEERSYSIGVPGLNRFLPTPALRRYADWTLRSRRMRFLCSERVFLFGKEP